MEVTMISFTLSKRQPCQAYSGQFSEARLFAQKQGPSRDSGISAQGCVGLTETNRIRAFS